MIKHLLFWLILAVLAIALIPVVVNPQTYLNKVKTDQHSLAVEFGPESADYIIRTADGIYNEIFEESGFHPWVIERFHIGKHVRRDESLPETNEDRGARFAANYTITFFLIMYEAVFRYTQLFFWATFAVPFIIAAIFDGFMLRKVRNVTFYYSSPSRYNIMWHITIVLFVGTAVYCITPLPMTAIAFPVIVFFVALTLRSLLANLQRSA